MAEKVKGMFKKGHHEDSTDPNTTTVAPGDAPGGELRNDDATTPHPSNPEGGAALTDEQGNLKPGPHQDAVKRETIVSKIKDKLHGSK